jgi:hypothetical protein
MGAVAEVVSDVFEPIGEVVGQVEKAIESAASEVGHVVEEVGQQVGKTVEAMAKDPAKALPLIAVAILAPELAPLLWEGATIAEAAMVLNTGMQLAQGADPLTVATNLATSAATMGITQGLDISTGFNPLDRTIGSAASAALQGQDINKAIGSSIGSQLIGNVIGAGTNAVKGMDFSDVNSKDVEAQDGGYYGGAAPPTEVAETKVDNDAVTTSETFRDAIYKGFSPEEAYAIAKGQMDAEASGPSPYAPTASNPTSDVPDASVKVEPAPDDIQGEGVKLPQQTKEELDQDLADGKLTQEEYDAALPNASIESKAEQEYVDPQGALDTLTPADTTPPDETAPLDGITPPAETTPSTDDPLGTTRDTRGNLLYTYDDGSTLTVSGDGEVVDVTEATDTGEYTDDYQEEEDPSDPTGKKGSGFSLKFGSGNKGRTSGAGLARKSLIKTPTAGSKTASGAGTSPTSSTGGLDSLGGEQYGTGLTSNVSKGNTEYSLLGEELANDTEGMASGGYVQHMASGSTPSPTQGVYDLSTTASSPFLGGGNSDIMALKPGVVKGKINYGLPGYPFGQEWKAAKAGGAIENAPKGHNPQFFSEGGLGSMKNTYVKGKGDGTSDSIAAMLANGEFVVPADVVSSLGNGSNDAGAKVLDEFLRTIRAHKRKADPKGLPPDSKGALGYLAAAKKKVKK